MTQLSAVLLPYAGPVRKNGAYLTGSIFPLARSQCTRTQRKEAFDFASYLRAVCREKAKAGVFASIRLNSTVLSN
jgi:hypothetical protein